LPLNKFGYDVSVRGTVSTWATFLT
jgi:hypothetical protein